MNIAVLGKSAVVGALEAECAKAGFQLTVLEDTKDIRSISGRVGEFVINARRGRIGASHILLAGEAALAAPAGALTLGDEEALAALPYGERPVAFVLDHPVDSPVREARAALEWAVRLAARKHRVAFLARYVRTAGGDLETLYRQARRLGVLFHKYESIEVDGTGDGFRIRLTDAVGDIALDARAAVFARSPSGGELERLAKLMRLRADERGVGGGRYHLFPARTSRKGVYFINTAACSGADELRAQASFILSDIRRDDWAASADPAVRERLLNPDGCAQVDAEKCAFCYTCYRICPHAAMTPDHEASAMKNVRESCAGCGICASVCPASAITMEGRAGDGAQKTPGRLRLMLCEHSGKPALDRIRAKLQSDGAEVSVSTLRCGGDLGAEAILSALGEADRVLVAVCTDDACRHFEGNKRAKRQVDRAREMLRASGLDEGRITFLQLSHAMPAALDESVREMNRAAEKEMV